MLSSIVSSRAYFIAFSLFRMPQDIGLEEIPEATEDGSGRALPSPRAASLVAPTPPPTADPGQSSGAAQPDGAAAAAAGGSIAAAAGGSGTPDADASEARRVFRFSARNALEELHEFETQDEDDMIEDLDETVQHLIELLKVHAAPINSTPSFCIFVLFLLCLS